MNRPLFPARMRCVLPVTGLLASLLIGCTMVERQETKNTEQLLAAAGFNIKPADTPQKLASLQAMRQRKVIRREVRPGAPLTFYYADATTCRCIYIGNEQNFQEYQRLATEQGIAIANQESALDASLDSYWAYDSWMPVY
jgi:hypothetical protein